MAIFCSDESLGSLKPRPAASESQRRWVAQAAAGARKAADAASSGEMKGECSHLGGF